VKYAVELFNTPGEWKDFIETDRIEFCIKTTVTVSF
jgi:hypothetical protein